MTPTVTPTPATLGAIVEDVELAALTPSTWSTLEDAFYEFGVLIFPGQDASAETQASFALRFGTIESLTPGAKLDVVPLTNLRGDGTLTDASEHHHQVLRGNEGWHTDSSYMPLAARASILSAQIVPPQGGETEWADMRAAYETLDPETARRIENLSAYHSLYYSQAKIGHQAKTGASYGFHTDGAPLRPLVKVHPVTGRKSLYIGRHAYGIPGLETTQSEELLSALLDHACRAPRVYQHSWNPGDLAIWDNRCVLHRARPYDSGKPRLMLHTRVAGDPQTEAAETNPEKR